MQSGAGPPAPSRRSAEQGQVTTHAANQLLRQQILVGLHVVAYPCLAIAFARAEGTPSLHRWSAVVVATAMAAAMARLLTRLNASKGLRQRTDEIFAHIIFSSPAIHILLYMALPNFNVEGSQYPAVLIFHLLLGAFLFGMPPMHSLLQLIVYSVGYGYLDYVKFCRLTGPCLGAAGVLRFLMFHWVPMFLAALTSTIVAFTSLLRHTAPAPPDRQRSQRTPGKPSSGSSPSPGDSSASRGSSAGVVTLPLEAFVPLESLGIGLFRRLGVRDFLLAYHSLVNSLATISAHDFIVTAICFAISAFCVIRVSACRLGFEGLSLDKVNADVLVLGYVACFTAGRQSSKSDIMKVLHHITAQLHASQSLLADMLPAHIVRRAISSMTVRGTASARHSYQEESHEQQFNQQQQQQRQQQQQGHLRQRDQRHVKGPLEAGTGQARASPAKPRDLARGMTVQRASSDAHALADGPMHLSPIRVAPAVQARQVDGPAGIASPHAAQQHPSPTQPLSPLTEGLARLSRPPARAASFSMALESYLRRDLGLNWHLPRSPSVLDNEEDSPDVLDMTELEHVMATAHSSVTIFFSDVVGFSTWASRVPPAKVMQTLDDLYSRLDNIILEEFPSLYKIETIGDAYVMAANLLAPDPEHAATAVRFALRAQQEVAKVMRPDRDDGTPLQLRIGLHSGSIMSGIVGKIRRRFCLFGDAMNMASRTESTCPHGCIQLTTSTYELAAPMLDSSITLRPRGEVKVKGHEQPLMMYLAEWTLEPADSGDASPLSTL